MFFYNSFFLEHINDFIMWDFCTIIVPFWFHLLRELFGSKWYFTSNYVSECVSLKRVCILITIIIMKYYFAWRFISCMLYLCYRIEEENCINIKFIYQLRPLVYQSRKTAMIYCIGSGSEMCVLLWLLEHGVGTILKCYNLRSDSLYFIYVSLALKLRKSRSFMFRRWSF